MHWHLVHYFVVSYPMVNNKGSKYTGYFCRALSCNFNNAHVNHLRSQCDLSYRDISGVLNLFKTLCNFSATN